MTALGYTPTDPLFAELDPERAEVARQRAERTAKREAAAERRQDRLARRAERQAARAEWRARLVEVARQLRPAAPISLVTALAMYGQGAYAEKSIADPRWELPARLVFALALAIAAESVSLYVQWHAHDALLRRDTLTAARLRRVSYLIAAALGAVQYSHFAGPDWAPTPAAVTFAGFSVLSPWLWGLHTRRASKLQLSRENLLDSTGASFSAERYRWFPIRTLLAVRWSIDHGVTDPRAAWAGYNAQRVRGESGTAPGEDPTPEVGVDPAAARTLLGELVDQLGVSASTPAQASPGRRRRRQSDEEILWSAVQYVRGGPPGELRLITSRNEFRRITDTGGERAERLWAEFRASTARLSTLEDWEGFWHSGPDSAYSTGVPLMSINGGAR